MSDSYRSKDLRAVANLAMNDPQVYKAGGAMIYRIDDEYHFVPRDKESPEHGQPWVRVMRREDDGWSMLPWCRESKDDWDYIASVINDEITEAGGEH